MSASTEDIQRDLAKQRRKQKQKKSQTNQGSQNQTQNIGDASGQANQGVSLGDTNDPTVASNIASRVIGLQNQRNQGLIFSPENIRSQQALQKSNIESERRRNVAESIVLGEVPDTIDPIGQGTQSQIQSVKPQERDTLNQQAANQPSKLGVTQTEVPLTGFQRLPKATQEKLRLEALEVDRQRGLHIEQLRNFGKNIEANRSDLGRQAPGIARFPDIIGGAGRQLRQRDQARQQLGQINQQTTEKRAAEGQLNVQRSRAETERFQAETNRARAVADDIFRTRAAKTSPDTQNDKIERLGKIRELSDTVSLPVQLNTIGIEALEANDKAVSLRNALLQEIPENATPEERSEFIQEFIDESGLGSDARTVNFVNQFLS